LSEARVTVKTWREHGEWVASDDKALVHAFGPTEIEALLDLDRERDEQRTRLASLGRQRLYPHLIEALDYLECQLKPFEP
jgi:hypothetical protein